MHWAGTQVPAWQMSASQSAFATQAPPMGQRRHEVPPQSTSVSAPFLTLSEQAAARQTLFRVPGRQRRPEHEASHTAVLQSVPAVQSLPSPHFPHVAPPQSMSVSSPF